MLNPSNLPEIVFASSDSQISRQISDLLAEGILRRLLPRVYTANLQDEKSLLVLTKHGSILGPAPTTPG